MGRFLFQSSIFAGALRQYGDDQERTVIVMRVVEGAPVKHAWEARWPLPQSLLMTMAPFAASQGDFR
jgi:hypothetical protein